MDFWYYTLSAIPQTLAAMIALAAAFVVVNLDSLSKKISDTRSDLRRFILLGTSNLKTEIHDIEPLSDGEFYKLYAKSLENLKPDQEFLGLEQTMFEKYKLEMGKRIINEEWRSYYTAKKERIFGYLKMKENNFNSLLLKRREILSLMKWSLLFAVFVIATSLAILPNHDYFNGSRSLVIIIVIGSILSMIFTAITVWKIAKA